MSNVLVTGSSSGLGLATARALAARGQTFFATMRQPAARNRAAADDLRRLAETDELALHVLDLDVMSDASVGAAVSAALARAGHLDVVVNSAGYALAGLAETYRYELKGTGVDVTIVQPGPFPTRLLENRVLGADVDRVAGYAALADGLERMVRGIEELLLLPTRPVPEEVAGAIVGLVESPPGTRPPRVVVDRFTGDDTRALNDAHARVEESIIASVGMAGDPATTTAPPGRRARAVTDGQTVLATVEIAAAPDRVRRALLPDGVELWLGSAGRIGPAAAGDPTVTYRVEPSPVGTRLTVRHDGFAGRAEAADERAADWARVLVRLEAYLRPPHAASAVE